jgi:hypothetical protein
MLKKKLKALVESQSLNQQDLGFEVISDSQAVSLIGGKDCPALIDCGVYNGTCPNLTTCVTYNVKNCPTFM